MTVLNYIEQQVDIHSFPSVHEMLCGKPGDEIVMGDLHANTIKLVYFLIRHGVMLGMTAEKYTAIVNICSKKAIDLTKEDLIAFNWILYQLNYNKTVTVSLIGDDLADRTDSCDVLTMFVIKALRQNQVPTKIHLSNHTSQMIEACELKTGFHSALLVDRDRVSMLGVHKIIENELMTQEEVIDLYNQFYKKSLRVNSCLLDMSSDGVPIVYMLNHAGIDLNTVTSHSNLHISSLFN